MIAGVLALAVITTGSVAADTPAPCTDCYIAVATTVAGNAYSAWRAASEPDADNAAIDAALAMVPDSDVCDTSVTVRYQS